MSVYLEVSVLFTFMLLYFVITVVSPSKCIKSILYICICCLVCSLVAVTIEYSWIALIACWILVLGVDYRKWVTTFILYVFTMQFITLIVPCQILNGILYFPISFSGVVVAWCIVGIILISLYIYFYNPSIYQFRYVMIYIGDLVIKGWGYLDSGNTSYIDGKPVIFIKECLELKAVFSNCDITLIKGIHGECLCSYVPCVIHTSYGLDIEACAVSVMFEGKYDFILNLYS